MDITKAQSAGYKITYIAMPGETGPRVLLDLRSPFSREATAAIKASFTADQWETIKAWGETADAYLIAAVNQFAVEDPYMMYSLVEGLGKVRVLTAAGNCYINTGFICVANTILDIEYMINRPQGSRNDIFGTFISTSDGFCTWAESASGQSINVNSPTINYSRQYWSARKMFHVHAEGRTATINDVSMTLAGTYKNTPYEAFLFTLSTRGTKNNLSYASVAKLYLETDGVINRYMIPCIVNGAKGMIDLANQVFYPNINGTGEFTIELGQIVDGVFVADEV